MAMFVPTAELPALTELGEKRIKDRHRTLVHTLPADASTTQDHFELLLVEAILAAAVHDPLKHAQAAWDVVSFRMKERVALTGDAVQERFMDAFDAVRQLMTV